MTLVPKTLVPEMSAVRRPPGLNRVCGLAVALVWLAAAPAAAQERGTSGESEVWDGGTLRYAERAFVALEKLRSEIVLLRGLAAAQGALLAWNGERADSGAGPAVLPAALCADERLAAWCRALPATFGTEAARATGGGQGE